MINFLIKVLLSAVIIAIISEVAKRSTLIAALIASLPIISLLSFILIYYETKDNQKIIELSYSIFWLVIPSLAFFLILSFLLKNGQKFAQAIIISSIILLLTQGALIFCYKFFSTNFSLQNKK